MKSTIPDVMPLVHEWVEESKSNSTSLEVLHCFMENGNIEDSFLEMTDEAATKAPAANRLANALKQMSKTQRRKITMLNW